MLTQGSMWIDLTIGGITMFSTEHSYNCLSSFKINQLTWISGSLPHGPIIFKYNRHLPNFSDYLPGSPISSLHLWHFSRRQRGLDSGVRSHHVGHMWWLFSSNFGHDSLFVGFFLIRCVFFLRFICRCVLLKMIHKLGTWSRTLRWWGTLADKKQFD